MTELIVIGIGLYVVACASYTGVIAKLKGYDPTAWAIGGFFFGVIALLAAAGLPSKKSPA